MKIGNPADKRIAPVDTPAAKAKEDASKAAQTASSAAADPSAKVRLSEAAKLLSGPEAAEFDNAKVERISLAAGESRELTIDVDAAQVAQASTGTDVQ